MGVLDKLKNALFEVEYVEVEEPPKKEKKVKTREKKTRVKEKEKQKEKPIAKKIVLPGRREEKVEELEEEDLKDEDFEIRPKNEIKKEEVREQFKFMDDKDFQVEEEYVPGNPEILHVIDENQQGEIEEVHKVEESIPVEDNSSRVSYEKNSYDYTSAYREEPHHDNKLYGIDNTYTVPVHQYGTYEKKEEKTYFKPSPIISPIYGVLDKNYTKDDVKEKKEVRLTTYSRSNVSVDDIRNKAYGTTDTKEEKEEVKFEVEEDDDNLLVDLSDRAKPEVKELTVGDAVEYFQDLGLEYNVDYVDVSKEKKDNAVAVKETVKKKEKETTSVEGKHVENKEKEETPKLVKVQEESKKSTVSDEDNDNLFDLIDSMYEEKGE